MSAVASPRRTARRRRHRRLSRQSAVGGAHPRSRTRARCSRCCPPPPAPEIVSWVRHGEGLVGWGRAARFVESGPTDSPRRRWWAGIARASSATRSGARIGTGGLRLVPLRRRLGRAARPGGARVVVGSRGGLGDHHRRRRQLPGVSTSPQPPAPAPRSASLRRRSAPPDNGPTRWRGGRRITAGELDKVVLARDLEARARRRSTPLAADQLAEHYDRIWTFAVEGLVGATPELLVRRDQGLVTSRVLAGTIRRTGDDAKDLALAASLARSSKDLEEHEYAVRSVADALGAALLVDERARVALRAAPQQRHAPGHRRRRGQRRRRQLARARRVAAPQRGGGGTPTDVAVPLIAALEDMDRGRYAGPVGWMDTSGDGEWGIALRCGRLDDARPGCSGCSPGAASSRGDARGRGGRVGRQARPHARRPRSRRPRATRAAYRARRPQGPAWPRQWSPLADGWTPRGHLWLAVMTVQRQK